jgi:hypothetical protein
MPAPRNFWQGLHFERLANLSLAFLRRICYSGRTWLFRELRTGSWKKPQTENHEGARDEVVSVSTGKQSRLLPTMYRSMRRGGIIPVPHSLELSFVIVKNNAHRNGNGKRRQNSAENIHPPQDQMDTSLYVVVFGD